MGDTADPPRDSPINAYAVLSDGSILPVDVAILSSKALADGRKITASLFLAEGLSNPNLLTELRTLVPTLPDGFITAHLCNNLAQVDPAIDENQVILAKWSRAAAQSKDVWRREKRLRTSKTPFNVDNVDPVTSRMDHERYDHFSEPYRSYDPIYEFCKETCVSGDPDRTTTAIINDPPKGKAVEETQGDPEKDTTLRRVTRAKPATAAKAKVILQDMIMHAAHECMSFYHIVSEDKLMCKLPRGFPANFMLCHVNSDSGVVMFDSPREHLITKVCYNLLTGGEPERRRTPDTAFHADHSYLEKFVGKLKASKVASDHGNIVKAVTDAMVSIVVEDHIKLLASISKSLDDIELSMEKDLNVPQSWRDFPPRWRNHLFHQSETIAYFVSLPSPTGVASSSQEHANRLERALKKAEKQVKATIERLEGTYQVLMSAMSILESERAIDQAEVVTRLTNLAFFFIPLTFVSGLFGMNIVEFDQKLTVGMWVGISAGVTAFTYFVRFRRPLATAAYQTPEAVRRLRWDVLIASSRSWTQRTRSLRQVVYRLVLNAVLGVAFWLAATKPQTDDAKIGITVSLLAVLALLDAPRVIPRIPLRLRLLQQAALVAFLSSVGVALWALATSSLPVDTKIGLALGVIGIPAFSAPTCYHIVTNPILGGRMIHPHFYQNYEDPERSLGSKLRHFLIATTADGIMAALCAAYGVAMWKLFTSPLSDATKIGVSIGAVGVPLALVSRLVPRRPPSERIGALSLRNVFLKATGVLSEFSILAVAIWKLSTASSLSVSAKLGIWVAIVGSRELLLSFAFRVRTLDSDPDFRADRWV